MVASAGSPRPERVPIEYAAGRSVLFVTPFSLDGNPYARQLTSALTAAGVDVRIARGKSPFVVWRGARAGALPSCVHLQWQHGLLTGRNLPTAILRSSLFFAQWAALRMLGVRFVWTVHNIVNHEKRQAGWELFASRVLARAADAVVAHCDRAADTVADSYRISRDRVRVIPHGAFEADASPARDDARRLLRLDPNDRVFLCFGRIRRYKGVERLLDAFTRLHDPRARLFIVGAADDPDLAEELAQRAAPDSRIRLRLHHVPDAELATYLAACDAAVLPYRDSLTSGAAVLAAAHARAVIGPRIGCLCDFPDGSGVFYEAGDANGLDSALAIALGAPLHAFGETGRDHVRRYPWRVVAERTIALYSEISPAFSGGSAGGATRLPEGATSPMFDGLRAEAETEQSEQVPAAGSAAHETTPPMVKHAE